MTDSILNSIKKLLGLTAEYDAFDQDLILCINTAISILTQLGVGPSGGFHITNQNETWLDFLGEEDFRYNMVKSYVHLKTKLLWDTTSLNGPLISELNNELRELEWRLSIIRKEVQ